MSRTKQEQYSPHRPWQQTRVQLSDGDSSSLSPASVSLGPPNGSHGSPYASRQRPVRPPRSPLAPSSPFASPALSDGRTKASGSHVSPPESIVREEGLGRNGNERQDEFSRLAFGTAKSHLMEKAFALSRSTSVRQIPQEDCPETDADHEERGAFPHDARKTNNNPRGLANSQSNDQHLGSNPSLTSTWNPSSSRNDPALDDGPGPMRFKASNSQVSSYVDKAFQGASVKNLAQALSSSEASIPDARHEGSRETVAWDSSDQGTLSRRDSIASVNTVRTAEFGAGGKWGRAWADRDEDDDTSLYGGSEWGGESTYEGAMGLSLSGGGGSGLDALRNLAKGADFGELTLSNASVNTATLHRVSLPRRADSQPAPVMSPGLTANKNRACIVSMAPSFHHVSGDRSSYFGQSSRNTESPPLSASPPADPGSLNTAAGTSPDSISSMVGPDGAHVFVWPPTPAGSETSHQPYHGHRSHHTDRADAASIHEWEAVTDDGSEGSVSQRSSIATVIASAPRESLSSEPGNSPTGPTTVSSLLSGQARLPGSPVIRARANGERLSSLDGRKVGGHPAGRPPPPPPSSHQYENPDIAIPVGARIGRTRAAAIAAADGRESIVSDLDVETLRLDGSSRRNSSSTLGSRMSIGTVRYSDDGGDRRSSSGPTSLDLAAPMGSARHASVSSPPSSNHSKFESDVPVAFTGNQPRLVSNVQRTTPVVHSPSQRPASSSSVSRQSAPTSAAKSSTINVHPRAQSPHKRTNPPHAHRGRHAVGQDTKTGPSIAENYLSQGIQYHEQGDLSRAAYYFERSAKVDGGCVVGMCMWGMTLREGWGARKDPRKGFEWIQRAAATAGELMSTSRNRTEADLKAVRSELKLSVYELGKCFCYGWGVKMDKKMALEYFELAAKLGDADAQAEAGALYAAGKGCKKDLKKAAKYYRMAAAQGYDLIGLSWVWKGKFDD